MNAHSLPALAVLTAAVSLPTLLSAQATAREHLARNVLGQMPWRELGPVTFGGRIVDLEVHPDDPAVFWAAAASGGLWKTTNGGLSWTPQFQDAYSISIGDLALAPSQPDTLYLGTGEANNQRSSYWGNGVYKSTDGGTTWQHLGLDGTEHIGRVAVHPHDPGTVFVAALGALYSPNEERGLYRSTDGGGSWERVAFVDRDTGFVDVVIDAQDPQVVWAASYQRRRRAWNFDEGGPGSRLWKSTDGGATFAQVEGGLPNGDLGRIGIGLFAGDPDIVYLTIENLNPALPEPATPPSTEADPEDPRDRDGDGDAADHQGPRALPPAEILADPLAAAEWAAGGEEEREQAQDPKRKPRRKLRGGEVWRSDDGGGSWRKTSDRDIGGMPGYYYGQILVDPSDSERVYVLSVPVYASADGGATWTPAERQRGRRGRRSADEPRARPFHGNLHVDHHALWIDPRDGRHCLLGNDGGLAVSWDRGANWDHLTTLPIAQYYTVQVDLREPYRIYGGTQDNGTWGFPIHAPGGLTAADAYRVDGGDGFFVACDPHEPDVIYTESQFGGMSRTDLRTGARQRIQPKAEKGRQPLRFNWMTPLVLSPHAPHTVYCGSQFVHRSRDRGTTWETISPDLTTNDADKKEGDVPHCTITMLCEAPRRAGLLWVGTDDGRVWRSTDGGGRWTELTDRFPEAAQGLWVSRIEASPHAGDTAFVAFTGYREDRREPLLFRTDDAGDTFVAIHSGLPQEPINVVRQHPGNPAVLLVGTEMGVYASLDDGGEWFALGNGLPRVAVHDLVVHPREHHVVLGTHGRGIWALDGRGLAALDGAALGRAFTALPPSPGWTLDRSFSRGFEGARTWSADNPFTTATFRWHQSLDGDDPVLVEVLDAAGEVLWRHEAEAKAGYHEVPWSAPRGPGAFGPGGRGGRQRGQRAGEFAVRLTCGEESATLPFRVH
ncbi:MAG: WD40/YVTN/BNR-like repeat-containing protein [Planctomycetota bacterium]